MAASQDQSTGTKWGCFQVAINGATALQLGDGLQNTLDILNATCNSNNDAVRLCSNLNLNGFSNWYLPCRGELVEMYQRIDPGATGDNENIGEFGESKYWSSVAIAGNFGEHSNAEAIEFDPDNVLNNTPSASSFSRNLSSLKVRAIRQF